MPAGRRRGVVGVRGKALAGECPKRGGGSGQEERVIAQGTTYSRTWHSGNDQVGRYWATPHSSETCTADELQSLGDVHRRCRRWRDNQSGRRHGRGVDLSEERGLRQLWWEATAGARLLLRSRSGAGRMGWRPGTGYGGRWETAAGGRRPGFAISPLILHWPVSLPRLPRPPPPRSLLAQRQLLTPTSTLQRRSWSHSWPFSPPFLPFSPTFRACRSQPRPPLPPPRA